MPELRNDEIAVLLRERLDTRQPRRLPERFVPPAQRSHRAWWAVAVAAAFVLGLAIATVFRPQVGEFVNSVRRALPVTTAPQANPTAPGQPGATRVPAVQPAPGSTPEPTPTSQPSAGGPSGGAPSQWKVGDPVIAIAPGGSYAEYAIAPLTAIAAR